MASVALFALASESPRALAVDRSKSDAPTTSSPSADSVQDIMFLADSRPIVIRLRITAGGKSFRDGWMESVRTIHKYLDRDNDGKLTKDELTRGSLTTVVRIATGGMTALPRSDMDTNPKDGVVSLDELADGLRTALGPFRVQVGRVATERNDALFNHLDADKNGVLTKEELEAASKSLAKLDLDEDELIDPAELEPFTNPQAMQMDESATRRGRYLAVPPVVELTPDDPSFRPVRILLKRYDKGGAKGSKVLDNLLSHDEFDIDPDTFAKADTDRDGQLDTEELSRFVAGIHPDIELDVKLSAEANGKASIAATGAGGKPLPASFKAQKLSGGDVELVVGEVHLEIHVDDGANAGEEAKQYYAGQFKSADTDNNGYLEKPELKDHGPFVGLFDVLDRDSDGKVYLKELDAFIDRQAEAAKSRMVMSAADQGRAIFAILDLNRDRQLGQREILGTLTRVTSWDLNHDGRVGSGEVPHHYQLTIGRSRLASVGMGNVQFTGPTANVPEAPTAGPKWFRRMDHNRDGDVSRREFLGSSAIFDRLDTNADGLLDADEAGKLQSTAKAGETPKPSSKPATAN